jgi:aryl-alcohol dehydrogenase-like predicted oxidoreductase
LHSIDDATPDLVPLGQSGIMVPPVGVGTWQWGDRIWWQYGSRYGDAEVRAAYSAAKLGGALLFDSAEIYGMGKSERLLGLLSRDDDAVVVATKFFPFPWRLRTDDLTRALRGSLRRLGGRRVDLYQVHWPSPPRPIEQWVDALARVMTLGLTRSVGVSNYDRPQTVRAAEALRKRGVFLASNQIAYSLLNRSAERNGVLKACTEMGVAVIGYSPLAMGMLSGKYSEANPPPGIRRYRFPRSRLSALSPLISTVRRIAAARERTASQIALNWVICKGAIPIPGAKNAQQAQENCGALGWRLTPDEVAELDEVSAPVS